MWSCKILCKIFICGEKLLFHTNFNTTAVKELVVFALQRRNIKYCDIYVTWYRKVLKGDEILPRQPPPRRDHPAELTDVNDLMQLAADPSAWAALATLVVMEVVLGVDNLIFFLFYTFFS